jgi:hypothetical protein
MAAELNKLMIRRDVLKSAWFHTAGAVKIWEERSVIFRGFERVMKREVEEPRILFVCAGSCGLWYARRTVVSNLSEDIVTFVIQREFIPPSRESCWRLQLELLMRVVWRNKPRLEVRTRLRGMSE